MAASRYRTANCDFQHDRCLMLMTFPRESEALVEKGARLRTRVKRRKNAAQKRRGKRR